MSHPGEVTITIGELGEFGLISRITARLPQRDQVLLGPGDDAAVVRAGDGRIVATTDLLIEGRHFRREWSTGYDVGRKAAAQNLADVAAMGAVPTALLVGLAAPPELPLDWADGLADGLADECSLVGASVAGGDISRAEPVVVAVTALGDLGGREPLTRAGARPGDVVAVVGRLGWSAAGYAILSGPSDSGRLGGFASSAAARALVAAHRRPEPPYEAGPAAAALGATAMCDVSDGLVQDLGHIAEASGVRVELDLASVPVPPHLAAAGAAVGVDPVEWALTGGEDHALAATFPAGVALPGEWARVGRVVAGEGVVVDGEAYERGGWDHFR